MAKQTTATVPKLRFKGFEDAWKEKLGEDVFKNHVNKNHNSDLPLLAATQDQGVVYRDELKLKINSSAAGIENYKIIEKGDFVISLRSFQGGIEYSEVTGISSPAYTVLKPKMEIADYFYKTLFKKESFINRLNTLTFGIRDGKKISYKDFKTLKLPYPSPTEQQKIADCLTRVDDWLGNLQNQKEKLEQYKKGMMQKVFNQEVRFKKNDGSDFPEWEEKQLKEVFIEHSNKSTIQDEYPVLTSSRKGIVLQSNYFNSGGRHETKNNVGFNILPNLYITFRTRSDDGRFFFNKNNTGKSGIISIYYPVLSIQNDVNDDFTLLALNYNWKYFYKYSVGTSQKVLSMKSLKELKLPFPDIKEQQKIAAFFTSIDDLIDDKSAEISKAQEWKKGLLQGLFV